MPGGCPQEAGSVEKYGINLKNLFSYFSLPLPGIIMTRHYTISANILLERAVVE
jgi:hypothetical protein